jgi:hypothetical protein
MRTCALLLAPALLAQAQVAPVETPLSAAERAEALAVLAQAKEAFLKATEGLSPAQRAWQPGPDRWSVDQCAEHIAVTGTLISGMITGKLLPGPRTPAQRAEIKLVDGKLLPLILDRSHKAKAPEAIAPKARFKAPGEAEAAFAKSHAVLEEAVRTSNADWRARIAPHPFFGALDAYQWTLLTAGHTLRHVAQIEEVKHSEGFPEK